MARRSKSLPLLVTVATVALVLGSFGTAVAGTALTKTQVKKIAAGVVAKAAPTLSVAKATTATTANTALNANHANTADTADTATSATSATTATTASNATNLGGLAPAAYLTTSYRYRLPVQTATTYRSYTFPGMTGGTYSFTYDVIMAGTGPATYCDMIPSSSPVGGEGYSNATPTTGFGRLHGSGIIQFTGNNVHLQCGGSSFTIYNGTETLSSVTFTKIDTLTEGTATSP